MAILSQTTTPVISDPLTLKLAAVEARLAALEAVLKIGSAGDVTLKSQSTISIEASSGGMFKCGTTLSLEGASAVTIKAWSTMNIQATGAMTLKGSMININ